MCTLWTWLISSCFRFWFLVIFLSGPSTGSMLDRSASLRLVSMIFFSDSNRSRVIHSSRRLLSDEKQENIKWHVYDRWNLTIASLCNNLCAISNRHLYTLVRTSQNRSNQKSSKKKSVRSHKYMTMQFLIPNAVRPTFRSGFFSWESNCISTN